MVSLPCVVTHFLSESQCLDGIQLFLPTLNYYRVPISYYRVVHAVHALLAVYCLLADFIVWFPLSLSPTFFHRQFHNSVVLTGAWWTVSGLPWGPPYCRGDCCSSSLLLAPNLQYFNWLNV